MRQRAVVVAVTVAVVLLCVALTSAAAALALWQPDIARLNVTTKSRLHADYSPDPRGVRFAPLQPSIIGAAQDDGVRLDATPAPQLPAGTPAAALAGTTAAGASETPERSTPAPGTGTPAVGTPTPARTPTSAPPTETATDVPPPPTDTPDARPTPTPTLAKPTASEPTVTPTPRPALTNTGLKDGSGNAPDTGGAGDGYEVTPKYACADDGLFAQDVSGGLLALSSSCGGANTDRHRFFGYGFNIPGGSTIKGITVRLDALASALVVNPAICVELSWDGGSSWTKAKTTPALTSSEATYLLGGETDTWGRTWGHSEFDDGKLIVRLSDTSLTGIKNFSLDWVAVNVTYSP